MNASEKLPRSGYIQTIYKYLLGLIKKLDANTQSLCSRMNALVALANNGEIPAGTLESEVVDARSGFSTLGGAVRVCVRSISYTYDSYYQGSVNMDTGEVVNTTKSVRTDMINPDDVALVHIPNGYQAYLFSYDATGGYLGRSNLGDTGVDVNGSDLKSYKENTITIRITIYNTNMEIDFDVSEFLGTGAYIKIKMAVADDIRALEEEIESIEQEVENIEDGMETLVQRVYEINETLSYTYDSYYQGSVNMDTGEVVNTTKSVRTDMINPDDVVSIHVPTGHRAFLFSYNSTGGFLGRSDLGSTGVDLSGTELKAYKAGTALIRITVYNLNMNDVFTVPEFLETGSYIQIDKVKTLTQDIADEIAAISSDIDDIQSDISDINSTLTFTYDSYYQGSVNINTGEVANTPKSVRTDLINPDDVIKLHIPTGYQAYLFSYDSDGEYLNTRTNLGKVGVDLTGAQLKAYKENTATIRITVYNQEMNDNFTVEQFLATGAYIKTKATVADDIKSLKSEVAELSSDIDDIQSDISELSSDIDDIQSDILELNESLSYTYDSYYQGGVNMYTGEVANTPKSVRTDLINPDDVIKLHIPTGYQAYLFSYDSDGEYLNTRTNLGKVGVDLTGVELKAYKAGTALIRITVYNLDMNDDFTVPEFLETGSYIQTDKVGTLVQNIAELSDDITEINSDIIEINENLSYIYDEYYQGGVNMTSGEVANTAKSVRTDMINPDDVVSIHVPTGHRAYLFSYDSNGEYLNVRTNLGSTGVDLTGAQLKAYKAGTASIRITVYNLDMNDDFTVEQFLATGAYIKIKMAVADDIKSLESEVRSIEESMETFVSEVEMLKYNDVYYAGGLIRRCYNPYKTGGSRVLVGQLHCHDEGWNQSQTGPKLFDTASHEETMQNYKTAGYHFVTLTNYSYFPLTHVDDADMPSDLTWLCDSAEVPFRGGYDEDGLHENTKHIVELNINNVDGWRDFVPLKKLPDTEKSNGAILSIAHPYWTNTYVTPEALAKVKGGIRFVEVWDGITEYHRERGDGAPNYVTYPTGKGSDYAFEQMLDQGLVTWALAISDVHSGRAMVTDVQSGLLVEHPIFKRGCVKVFADNNNRFEILKNLASGNFYASSNVDTSITAVSFTNGTYHIETGSSTAVTKFMKEGGTVVKTVTGNIAEYTLDGSEKYVRAVISWDTGTVDYEGEPIYEKIWTQPVINIFKPDYDNYFDYSLIGD